MEATKKCTKCLDIKSVTSFYLKRNQYDTICKTCKKSARKSKYVSKKTEPSVALFKHWIQVFCSIQEDYLTQKIKRLQKVYEEKTSKGQLL